MDIGKKILELRKKNNLSQEELAEKVGVARQTISKWELNETSPDLKQASLLAKIFNVSLDELVNNDIKYIDNKTNSNAEKLASIIFAFSKISLILLIVIIIGFIFLKIIHKPNNSVVESRIIEESIYCTIYGEEHGYTIKYNELTGSPISDISDGYFNNILDLTRYKDALQIFDVINDYVKKNGGTCEMIKDRDLSDIVNMYIKEGTLTNTSAIVIINDNNPNRIVYGSNFYIEKYNNNTWSSVKTTGENYGFNAMAYYVNKEGILEMNQDWTHIYGELPKGIYRLVKDVFFESDTPVNENDKFYIWTEFEIK